MGSEWVDGGPSLGSALSGVFGQFTAAPGKALDNMLTAEQIKAARANQGYAAAKAKADAEAAARENEIFQAQRGAADAFSATVPPVGPVTQTVPGPFVGTANDPANAALPTAEVQYTDPNAEATRTFFDKYGRAVAYKSPKDLPGAYANTQVGVSGVPETQGERDRLQYLQTGKFDKTESKPFVVIDPATKEVVRVYASGDGGRTDIAGNDIVKQYGAKYQIAPAGSVDPSARPKSMFDTEGATWDALSKANNAVVAGVLPNPKDTRELAVALEKQFPSINKVMSDAIGNTMKLNDFMEKNIPRALHPLVQHIADQLYPQPAAQSGMTTPTLTQDPFTGQPITPTTTEPTAPPLTAEQRLRPQTTTETIKSAPATAEMVKEAQRLGSVRLARTNIDQLMGTTYDANGVAHVAPGSYTPNWMAGLVRESTSAGTIQRMFLNKLDPDALQFFNNAAAVVEPILRTASGAVTPPNEVNNYMQMLIPNAQDTDRIKEQKLTQLKVWEEATASAGSADDAINKIVGDKRTTPQMRAEAERLRVRAREAGTLTQRPDLLVTGPAVTPPASTTTAPPPAVSSRARGAATAPGTGRSAAEIVGDTP